MNTVQSLNVSTGHWEALPPLSAPRYGATLCVVDGRLFVIGGNTASVEEYIAMERRWVSVLDMPRAVTGAAAVTLDGKLLVVGGWDSSRFPLTTVLEISGIAAGSRCPACSLRALYVRYLFWGVTLWSWGEMGPLIEP